MDTPSGLEEIVVTAQKRADNINDVPLSIATASGAELLKRGIADPTQLELLVPGFSYQKSSYGVPVFSLRGVGFYDTTQGVTPAVAVYVDEIPLPYSAMTRGAALDVERVEVLKGPQGTLFGQNSTGGAINYIAAKPTDALRVRHVSRLRHIRRDQRRGLRLRRALRHCPCTGRGAFRKCRRLAIQLHARRQHRSAEIWSWPRDARLGCDVEPGVRVWRDRLEGRIRRPGAAGTRTRVPDSQPGRRESRGH